MPTTPLDIDALIAPQVEKNLSEATHAEITFNGQVWHLYSAGPVIGLVESMGGGDGAGAAFIEWMVGMVVPDEREGFRRLLRTVQGIDGEILTTIAEAMSGALAERPTEPSSPKRRSSLSRTSVTPSTEISSSEDSPESTDGDGLTL